MTSFSRLSTQRVAALPQPSCGHRSRFRSPSMFRLCVGASVCKRARTTPRAPLLRTRHRRDRPAARLRAPLLFCRPLLAGGRAFPGQEHRNVGSRCQRRGCTNRATGGEPAATVPPSPIPVARRTGLGESPHRRPRCFPLGQRALCLIWWARPQRRWSPPRRPSGGRLRGGCSGRRGGEGRRRGRGVGSVDDRHPRGGRTSCRHRRRPPC